MLPNGTLVRTAASFAGPDSGGHHWATLATLLHTAKSAETMRAALLGPKPQNVIPPESH